MGLPWEPSSDGPPAGVGIGISGGGLRSAAFALGVLQALQERRGLLFGERSAELLAVVSGGSYPAATHALEARRQADEGDRESAPSAPPPLAHGSPEERHLLANAEYFGTARWRFLALTALNITALAFLVGWTAWFLADLALIVELALAANPGLAAMAAPVLALSPAILLPATIAGLYFVIRGLYHDGGLLRYGLPALGLVLLAVATPGAFRWLDATTGLWTREVAAAEALFLLALQVVAFVAPLVARRIGVRGLAATALNRLAVWSPRILLLVIVAWFALGWYLALGAGMGGDPTVDQLAVLLWLFAILIGGLVFSNVPHRASLHREYRERIASGFAVRRRADGGNDAEAVGDALLSSLGPPASGSRRYPRLLVCATANVGVPGPTGRSSFVPFVFSHDRCGVPGHPEAVFDTERLECVAEPAGLLTRRRESLVSLMTAVAATGAGVAPSMGRMTQPSAGMFIAALNIRPGRWLPNPFSRRARRHVSERCVLGPLEKDQKMGPGYNELIPEMFRISGSRVYVSDGAHYDNLALMTLLRARCSEIWILDASPEPRGQSDEIQRIVALAFEEIGAVIDVDLTPFLAGPDGRLIRPEPVVGGPTQRGLGLDPHGLGADREPDRFEAVGDRPHVGGRVPDVGDLEARNEVIGCRPVGSTVALDGDIAVADRARSAAVVGTTPREIQLDPIGRIGHQEARRGAGQQPGDVVGIEGVAHEEPMPAQGPELPGRDIDVAVRGHHRDGIGHVRANASAVAPFNTIIASSSDISHPITVVKSNSQGMGATVCFFGFTTHSASPCGVIEVVSVSGTAVREDGKSLNLSDMIQMTKVTQGGDSGGPVYSGLAAYGIVTAAGTSGHMIYSKIVNASNLTAISLCVSSSC